VIYVAGVLAAVLVLGGAVGTGVYGHKRLGQSWRLWLLGGATFIASQVVHFPLLHVLTPWMTSNESSGNVARLAINIAILGLSAGLCEELARYLMLRRFVPSPSWAQGVMFGAGHGATEAIVLVPFGVVQTVVLLTKGDEILAAVKKAAPEQAEQIAESIRLLRESPAYAMVGSVWERGIAICLHVALTLLVVRAVRTGRMGWLMLAVLAHATVDSGAVVLMRVTHSNVLAIEGVLTAAALGALAFVRAERPA
jgi:uncharacterized membrane protein YhfC